MWGVWPMYHDVVYPSNHGQVQGLLEEMFPFISVPEMTFSVIMCRVLNVKFTFLRKYGAAGKRFFTFPAG